MKTLIRLAGLMALAAAALAGSGCGGMQMDTQAASPNANRIVTGTVELGDGTVLPPDAQIALRVLDVAHRGYVDQNAAALGKPNAPQGITLPPDVIAEQRIDHPQGTSIPFSVRFAASDQQMQGGLVLEARVSYGGRVRFFNVESYAINTANIDMPRRVDVNGVR